MKDTRHDALRALNIQPDAPVIQPEQAVADAKRKLQEERDATAPTTGEAWEIANQLDNTFFALDEAAHRPAFDDDPLYSMTAEEVAALSDGIPSEYKPEETFKMARSREQALYMRERFLKEADLEDQLSKTGAKGVLLRIGANIADPVAVAVSIANPLGAGAARGARIARMAKGFTAGAVEAGLIETAITSVSQTRGIEDVIYAAAGGGLLSGLVNSLGRGFDGELTKAERAYTAKIADDLMNDMDRLKAFEEAGVVLPDTTPPLKDTPKVRPDDVRARVDEEPVPTLKEHQLDEIGGTARFKEAITAKVAKLSDDLKVAEGTERTLRKVEGIIDIASSAKSAEPGYIGKLVSEASPEVQRVIRPFLDEQGNLTTTALTDIRDLLTSARRDITVLKNELGATKYIEQRHADKIREALDAEEDRSVGAQQVIGAKQEFFRADKIERDLLNEIISAPVTAMGGLRFDISASLKTSKNPFTRWMGSKLLEDPVGNVGNETLEFGAELLARHRQTLAEVKFYRVTNTAFDDYLRANGHNGMGLLKARYTERDKFFSEVTRTIRGDASGNPHVDKVASVLREIYSDFLDAAKQAGVKGFETLEKNINYSPRLPSPEKIRELNAKYGDQVARKLLRGAIRAGGNVSDEVADALAKGYWNRVQKRAAGINSADMRPTGLSLDNAEFIREVLEESALPRDEIEAVMEAFKRAKPTDAGRVARGKHRVMFDETFEMQLKQGPLSPDRPGELDIVRVAELFEENAETLFHSYSRSMSGHIALAEKGFKSKADFERMLLRGREYGADDVLLDVDTMNRDETALRWAWDRITGVPLEKDPTSWFSKASRRVRDYNFLRVMNQVGFAQIAEFGNMIGLVGMRNVMRHMPEFVSMLKRVRSGDLSDDLARELEDIAGLGADWVRHPVATRWDDFEYRHNASGRVGRALDMSLDAGRRFVSASSLLVPINTVLHRLTMKGIAQRFVNAAHGLEKMSPERLASMGLHEKMLARINEQLRTFGKTDGSNKLLQINIEQWTDGQARDAFTYALFRQARRVVQENDIGSNAMWAHGPIAKIMFQFRSFAMNAWSKQLLHNVHMRDAATTQAFLMSMMFGGLSYMAQTHLNVLGRDDREKELKKRLALDKLAAAAFQRAGFASLLPIPVDTVVTPLLGDPLFMGRTTQQPSDALLGNPTVGLYNSAVKSLSGVRASYDPSYRFSRQNLRGIVGLAPLQNAFGITQGINALASELPKYSERK